MTKRAAVAAVVALTTAGCGGSGTTGPIATPARSATSHATTPVSASDEVVGVPSVGGFYGLCPRGARVWTLRFLAPVELATDLITYELGADPARRVALNRGGAVTFRLVPNLARVVEPVDSLSGHQATTVATTPPLDIQISQGAEAQELRVDIHLALTTIGGESSRCALAGSWVKARVYTNSTR
ncbi:MAG: hypothetical protein ACLP8S_19895 [Solirubrobacteraceae bacterium]